MSLSAEKRSSCKYAIASCIEEEVFNISAIGKATGVSAKTIHALINEMINSNTVERSGKGKYKLVDTTNFFDYMNTDLDEDNIYRNDIRPVLQGFSENAIKNVNYVFSEIFNNAIEHSKGNKINCVIKQNIVSGTFLITDNGIGIFENIKQKFNLKEKRYAILELTKGKVTTDPKNHSGEGIFFSSKICEQFSIFSDELFFIANAQIADEYLFDIKSDSKGTVVVFKILKNSDRSLKELFEKFYSDPDEMNFDKTIIPVSMLGYGEDDVFFVSRSQAKRLLARFERFINIILDFEGVDEIGQAFADEIFRVYKNEHPEIIINYVNCTEAVERMIIRSQKRAEELQ